MFPRISIGCALIPVLLAAAGCAARCERSGNTAGSPDGDQAPALREAGAELCVCPSDSEPRTASGGGDRAADDRPWTVGDGGSVELAEPDREGGLPLMQALSLRRSTRDFGDEPLSLRHLSELLWAGFGVNRADGRRTAPSAHNRQEMDLYVATAQGLFLYDAQEHRLQRVSEADVRALTGTQDFVARAPVNLIYVADFSRMEGRSDEERSIVASAAAGAIAQGVYLYCASEGLATVVRGSVDRDALAPAMGLSATQHIMYAQTVGHPAQ